MRKPAGYPVGNGLTDIITGTAMGKFLLDLRPGVDVGPDRTAALLPDGAAK